LNDVIKANDEGLAEARRKEAEEAAKKNEADDEDISKKI